MAEPRKVDKLVGGGSFADKLRRHREAVEAGDLEGAAAVFSPEAVRTYRNKDGAEISEAEFDALPEKEKARLRGD